MGLLFWLPVGLPVIAIMGLWATGRLKRLIPEADLPWSWVDAVAQSFLWVLPSAAALTIVWFSVRACLTLDKEYWNGWLVELRYTEQQWRMETYTTTDSKGNVTTRTRLVYDPPSWAAVDSMGGHYGISSDDYRNIAARWGNHHPPSGGSSGRTHSVSWGGDRGSGIPVTVQHHYKNKTLACHTVFSFRGLTQEEAEGLHPWPSMRTQWHAPMLLGYRGDDEARVDRMLAELNADLGASRQIRVHVLVFYGRGADVAELQREHWKGGKKNELNICLGLDDESKVEWCRVFSWSESETLKAEIAMWPEPGKRIDWDGFIAFVREEAQTKWQRKRFEDFDYLTVDMPGWAVLLSWFIGLAMGVTGVVVRFTWGQVR